MIVLYSNDCPRCKILKAKLDQKGVEYQIVNDVALMISMGMSMMPVLEVEGVRYEYGEAVKIINSIEGSKV